MKAFYFKQWSHTVYRGNPAPPWKKSFLVALKEVHARVTFCINLHVEGVILIHM